MRYLRENTATRVTVGPFIDKTDGFTPEIALTVTSELLTFIVDDAGVPTLVLDVAPTASGGNNDMVHITSDAAGMYDLELTAANTNYTGRAILSLNDAATHLPVWHEFQIVSANVYDSMFTDGDVLDVSVIQVAGATTNVSALATNADAIKTKVDFLPAVTAGGAGGVFIAGTNAATTITTSLTTTFTGNLTGSVDSVTGDTKQTADHTAAIADIPTVAEFDARTIISANYFDPAVDTVTLAAATHTGAVIPTVTTLTNLPAITADWLTAAGTHADFTTEIQTGLATSAALTTAQNDLDIITGTAGVVIVAADIAASALDGKGDWNTVVPDAAGVAPTAAENATQVWEELTVTARTAGTYGQLVKDDINATISSRMPTTHLNATTGKLDGVALADTVTTYTGNTLQTGDVATLITTVGAAGVGLTDLGGMSTTMKAQVQTEADASLVTYDAPTNTEFEVRTPTAAQLAYIVANAATGLPVTFTTSGGSTTAAVLALVDGGAPSATNDQYNGRLLVFTNDTLKGVVTDITDYVGGTTTATITAIPTPPTSSHTARLI